MIPKEILPKLTKDYISKCGISDIDIFEKYLGTTITIDEKFCNTLRPDVHPTCDICVGKDGRLRMKDWSGFFSGDCYDLVAFVINNSGGINVRYIKNGIVEFKREFINLKGTNSKIHFTFVLKDIAKAFSIHEYANDMLAYNPISKLTTPNKTITKRKHIKLELSIDKREWDNTDIEFWKPIPVGRLILFNTTPVLNAYMNGEQIYSFNHYDRCYCYNFKDEDVMQLYFPQRQYGRFILTGNKLIGLNQMLPFKIGVVQKSNKDRMAMSMFKCDGVPIPVVHNTAESYRMTYSEAIKLKYSCDMVLFLSDFDFAGILAAIEHALNFGFKPLFFVRKGILRLSDFRALIRRFGLSIVKFYIGKEANLIHRTFPTATKDFYDHFKQNGYEITQLLIDEVYEKLQIELDSISKYNYKLWQNES